MSKKNKMIISIVIAALVLCLAIYGLVRLATGESPAENSKYATITVENAMFGAAVRVTMTQEGKASYPKATKYQVYEDTAAISPMVSLAEPTTIFPAKAPGETVTLKLYSDENKEAIASIKLTLKKKK